MKILIVDDERLARERLRSLINELGIGEVIAEAPNGKEVLHMVRVYKPEVVLLDIRMPGIDGMQVAQELTHLPLPPLLIFTTAYSEHALDAFEKQAVDYLLKPIRKDRLERALKRAYTLITQAAQVGTLPPPVARSHISVNVRGELRLIPVTQVYYFLAEQKYVVLYWPQGQVLLDETLKDLEKEFAGQFLRIHRRTLVSLGSVTRLVKDKTGRCYVHLKEVPERLEVSRRHLPEVRKTLRDMRIPGV